MAISRCFASLVDVEMMKRITLRLKCALMIMVVSGGAGCGGYRTRDFKPETADSRSFGYVYTSSDTYRPVILLGRLENPRRSPYRWRDIGKGMTDVLSRELRAAGTYDVWISTRLAREIDSILNDLPTSRQKRLDSLRGKNPDIHYVILGRVTDFLHIQRRDDNPRNGDYQDRQSGYSEALVAIEFSVVDIESGRVILNDHVTGSVLVEDGTVQESYRTMSFESYRFWDTPLGRASRDAIGRVIDQVQKLPVPEGNHLADAILEGAYEGAIEEAGEPESSATVYALPERETPNPRRFDGKGEIRIVSQVHPRKIEVVWTRPHLIGVNEVFFVSRYDPDRGSLVSINDPDTSRPLQARIIATTKKGGTALLIGMKPRGTDLRGAILTRRRALRILSKMTISSEADQSVERAVRAPQ